jgi:hypothetical protein
MSEGYTVEVADEIVGIIVRQEGERGYRFHSAMKEFDALDGLVFVKPAAAQRAATEFVRLRGQRRAQDRVSARAQEARERAIARGPRRGSVKAFARAR